MLNIWKNINFVILLYDHCLQLSEWHGGANYQQLFLIHADKTSCF